MLIEFHHNHQTNLPHIHKFNHILQTNKQQKAKKKRTPDTNTLHLIPWTQPNAEAAIIAPFDRYQISPGKLISSNKSARKGNSFSSTMKKPTHIILKQSLKKEASKLLQTITKKFKKMFYNLT